MAAENQSEAVPDFPPSNYGGVGGGRGGGHAGLLHRSIAPRSSWGHSFSPNQLFCKRSGFPSSGQVSPSPSLASLQQQAMPANLRNESGRVSSCDDLQPCSQPRNHLAQACKTGKRLCHTIEASVYVRFLQIEHELSLIPENKK